MLQVTEAEIEAAYQERVKGRVPQMAQCSGSLILLFRPDLRGSIEPDQMYFVTETAIVRVEEQ